MVQCLVAKTSLQLGQQLSSSPTYLTGGVFLLKRGFSSQLLNPNTKTSVLCKLPAAHARDTCKITTTSGCTKQAIVFSQHKFMHKSILNPAFRGFLNTLLKWPEYKQMKRLKYYYYEKHVKIKGLGQKYARLTDDIFRLKSCFRRQFRRTINVVRIHTMVITGLHNKNVNYNDYL